jgi:hypothetical protein
VQVDHKNDIAAANCYDCKSKIISTQVYAIFEFHSTKTLVPTWRKYDCAGTFLPLWRCTFEIGISSQFQKPKNIPRRIVMGNQNKGHQAQQNQQGQNKPGQQGGQQQQGNPKPGQGGQPQQGGFNNPQR